MTRATLPLTFTVTLLVASTLHAQERPQLVVVTASSDASLGARLAAELRTLGLPVETRTAEGADLAHARSPLAEPSTLAAVALNPGEASARLCAREQETVQCEDLVEPDVDVLLIRLVEAVRARVDVPPDAPQETLPDVVCPAATPSAPAVPHTSQWTLRLGVDATAPLDAFSTSLAFAPSLAWQPDALVSVHLEGALSVLASHRTEDVGQALVGYQSLMVGLALHVPSTWLGGHEMRAQINTGMTHVEVHADARAPALGRDVDFVSLRLGATLAATFWATERVGLGLGIDVGALLPPRVLVLADIETASWGTPWLAADAHLAVRLD